MRIAMKFAEVHNQVFLNGTNLGLRFGTGQVKGGEVGLVYDTNLQCLIVSFKGKATLVPFPTISSMEPVDPSILFDADKGFVETSGAKPQKGKTAQA